MSQTITLSPDQLAGSGKALTFAKKLVWQLGIVITVFLLMMNGFYFGKESFIQAETVNAGNMHAHYISVLKKGEPTTVTVTLQPSTTTTTVQFDQNLIKNFHVKTVLPQPAKVSSDADHIQYTFVSNPEKSLDISLELIPDILGESSFSITSQTNTIKVNQLLIP